MTNQKQQAVEGLQSMDSAESRNRRRFKNYLIKPRYQIKFAYHLMAAGCAMFGTTMILVMRKLAEIDALLHESQVVDALVRGQISDVYTDINQITLTGFFVYVAFTFIYAMVVSHRVSGPMVSIVAFIDELKKGNYSYKRNLRRRDELAPIMNGLQELAEIQLQNRNQSSPPQ
jgi:hypothetical protein